MPDSTNDLPDVEIANLISNYEARAEKLLEEIIAFKEAYSAQGKKISVGSLQKEVRCDVRAFESAAGAGLNLSPEDVYKVRHMNMPKYEAVWNHAKRCSGVTALRERMSVSPTESKRAKSLFVDIIAEDGLEWIQVCTINEKRMLFDLAKQGWRGSESDEFSDWGSEDDDGHGIGGPSSDQKADDDRHEIVKHAKELVAAARARRVDYRHPTVKFILTRIHEGRVAEIDSVLADMRSTGVLVQCDSDVEDLLPPSQDLRLSSSSAEDSSFRDRSDQHLSVSGETLNIDCTILMALVSDISHLNLPQVAHLVDSNYTAKKTQEHFRQIEAERVSPLLANKLYPILTGFSLLCTSEAARVLREITEKIGTATEVSRMKILMGEGEFQGRDASQFKQELQALSIHTVPDTLKLPVKVVDFNADDYLRSAPSILNTTLPPDLLVSSMAKRTCDLRQLSPLNKSVFTFGWKEGITTITRSMTVARAIEESVSQLMDELERANGVDPMMMDGFCPPSISVMDVERSLLSRPRPSEMGIVQGHGMDSDGRDKKERRRFLRSGFKDASAMEGKVKELILPTAG